MHKNLLNPVLEKISIVTSENWDGLYYKNQAMVTIWGIISRCTLTVYNELYMRTMHIGSGLRLGSIRKKRNLFNNLFPTSSLNYLVNFNESCTKSCMLVFHCVPRSKKFENFCPRGAPFSK